ncbi:cobalamin biosynthesis protein [Stetteria hydrogenophila]
MGCPQPGGWWWAAALAAAVALDVAYPRHSGILYLIHPVRLSFIAARRLARPYSGVARGVLVWLAVSCAVTAPAAVALCLAGGHPVAWLALSAAILKFSASLRLLVDTVRRVASSLEGGRLEEARAAVAEIVRRPTRGLSAHLVASAAIESLAENLVDGYTSPLTYYPILGPLGPLLQRAANTLDGAIGYKTPEYERVGKPSAHIDTVLNYIPARLTALLIALAAPLAGGSVRGALRSWLEWRGATESLNAGHPMAAMAGALGVRLEKRGHYVINPRGRPPGPGDIARAVRVSVAVAAAYTLAVLTLALALHP